MNKKTVAVVIPIHKTKLNPYEKISLEQCLKVLGNYSIYLSIPDNLPLGDFEIYKDQIIIHKLSPDYFKDANSYNKLLVTKEFYTHFSTYKYILIHQLDVFIFRDELIDWCNKDYDYIGAPWFEKPDWISQSKPSWAWRNNLVGNGGLSLRKVSTFIKMLNLFSLNAFFFKRHAKNAEIHEDVFWSLYIPSLNPFFKLPDVTTALKFSFEVSPSKSFELNDHQLPFGCHAWEKFEIDFWRKIFEKYNYTI